MKCPECGTEVFDIYTTEQRIKELYKMANRASWAKQMLSTLRDMTKDRADNPQAQQQYPLSMAWITKELTRIIDGIGRIEV